MSGANRYSPKGPDSPEVIPIPSGRGGTQKTALPARPRPPRLKLCDAGRVAGRHSLDANNYMLWVIYSFSYLVMSSRLSTLAAIAVLDG